VSIPSVPERAALVVGALCGKASPKTWARERLESRFGSIQEEAGPLDFTFTTYYNKELGQGIKRFLWFFAEPIERDRLVSVKLATNEMEQLSAKNGMRTINLDPGFLTLGNFVLATGKNNAHRIYLSEGIFAEITLIFRKNSFRPLEWTYPDYADPELIGILNRFRDIYKCKITH
jgi:hypothetical protein